MAADAGKHHGFPTISPVRPACGFLQVGARPVEPSDSVAPPSTVSARCRANDPCGLSVHHHGRHRQGADRAVSGPAGDLGALCRAVRAGPADPWPPAGSGPADGRCCTSGGRPRSSGRRPFSFCPCRMSVWPKRPRLPTLEPGADHAGRGAAPANGWGSGGWPGLSWRFWAR